MFKERFFKGALLLWASILASLFYSASASALSVSELEQISDTSEYIELAEPEEGYSFDATFLAKDQELSYKATITNDEEYRIRISNITLNASSYDFLEYSFGGLEIGDELGVGEEKEIIVTVKTNNNNTQTVSEDYSLKVDYDFIKPEDNPVTTSSSFFKTAAAATVGVGAIVFLLARSKKLRHFAIIFTISSLGVYAVASNATAEEDTSFTILGKVNFINTYKVTVNPNGGIYEGKTTSTEAFVREGGIFHVGDAIREHFQFVEWEVNPGALDANNDIEIHADTTIKAKWNENTYTLTIKPNGGEYLGSTEEWSESFRPNEAAAISTPELEGYDFTNWTVEKGNVGTDGIFTGSSINMVEDITLVANYSIKQISVKIDPNGGTFNDEAAVYEDVVDWGTEINITNIARDGFDLKEWTVAEGNLGTNGILSAETSTITITEDTEIIANWWSSTFYTVTIIPNGGVYDGKTETSEYSVREGTDYTMLEATREGQLFHYWHYTDTETHMDDTSFTVAGDVSLTAEWQPIIARIERTQKLYPSIMAAHEEAESGDTITLLVDTSEIVTNSKNVTLDLNTHTVSGYLVNTEQGNLLLVNGEFDNYTSPIKDEVNPYGAAAINNGILTLGYDDYTDNDNYNKAPLIDNDYVRLVGDERGLIQNNIFYFYDGHIDGDLGLVGGYDGSPWYRDTDSPDHDDTQEVHYYPHVSRLTRDEASFQRVQLANSNRAVSRTIDHGAIYYYELQDNINMSAVTGYTIYAARNFDGSNPTEIASGDTIVFDTDGYKVDLGGTFTNNGTLTIKDGKTGEAKGELTTGKTIENNGSLTIQDITITGTQENNLVDNTGAVELKNAKLTTGLAETFVARGNSAQQLVMDKDSIIESTSDHIAIDVLTDLEMTEGNVKGVDCVVNVASTKTFTLKGGKIEGNRNVICNAHTVNIEGGEIVLNNPTDYRSVVGVNGGDVNMSGGKISGTITSTGTSVYGMSVNTVNMTAGEITIESASSSEGIHANSFNITGGTITTKATGNAQTTAVYANNSSSTINGKDVIINAISENGTSRAVSSYSHCITFTAGTANATSTNGEAFAYYASGNGGITINGDNAKLYAESENNNAYGTATNDSYYWGYSYGYLTLRMSAGEIKAVAKNSNKLGLAVDGTDIQITGGEIYGSSYGINHTRTNHNSTATIGTNEAPLYNGKADPETEVVYPATPVIEGGKYGIYKVTYVNFYDGIIKGGLEYIMDESEIKAIPDGTKTIKKEKQSDDDTEDCWLEYELPYLELEDGSQYRALGDAYENVSDGGTITVIRDFDTQAVLPNNDKNITIDLNGKKLVYTQPLLNTGTLKIVDGDTTYHRGSITNTVTKIVDNSGTLEISSGTFTGGEYAIYNERYATFYLKGGTLNSSGVTVYGDSDGLIEMSDGSILATGGSARGISSNSTAKIKGGSIDITGSSEAYGMSVRYAEITGGTISATGTGSATTVGVYTNDSTASVINGDDVVIKAEAESGSAFAISSYQGIVFTSGTATAKSINGEAVGMRGADWSSAYLTMNGANAKLTAESENNNAFGTLSGDFYLSGYGWRTGYLTITMSAGEIKAETKNADKVGEGIAATTANLTGGKVYGSSYGLINTRGGLNVTLGTNAEPLYNGQADPETGTVYSATPEIEGGKYGIYNASDVYFYDGIIKGGIAYVANTDLIKAIPDGTHQVVVNQGDREDCWLEYDAPYLELEDGSRYRSLSEAYQHVGDGETITVIRDASTQAVLPNNGKNITLDLNGFKLEYTQPLLNSGTLTIVDGDTEYHRGSIKNTMSYLVDNSGTLNVESGTLEGGDCTINVRDKKNFYLKGGVVSSTYRTICAETDANIEVSGGEISANGASVYGISGGLVMMKGGAINVTGSSSAQGMSVKYLNMTNGSVSATGTGSAGATGIYTYVNTASVINGDNITIDVNTVSGTAIALSSYYGLTFTSGTATAKSVDGEAIGMRGADWSSASLAMNGANAKLTAESDNNNAFGTLSGDFYLSGYGWRTGYLTVTMSAGEIKAEAKNSDKIGKGIAATNATITGGEVYATTYGITSTLGGLNVTLGDNEAPVSAEAPKVEGGTYGIYESNNTYIYDGVVRGGTDAIYNIRRIRAIADNTNLNDEKVDGKDLKYLVAAEPIAQIGTGDCNAEGAQCFNTMIEAINASNEGDTITLLRDDYVFYYLTMPEGKKFTIDLAGHNVITGNKITNGSDATIVNSGAKVVIDFDESDAFITNASGSKLTIDGVDIDASYAIYSATNTTTTLKNLNINYPSSQTAVNVYGNLTLDGANISASSRAVYVENGIVDIKNSTINSNNTSIRLISATGSIKDTTLGAAAEGEIGSAYEQGFSTDVEMSEMTINGTMKIENGKVAVKNSTISNSATVNSSTLISNSGTMTISDGTTITDNIKGSSYKYTDYIINNSGSLTIDDVVMSRTESYYNSEITNIGINNTGTIDISDSSITMNSVNSAFVLHNTSGKVTSDNTNYIVQSAPSGYGIYAKESGAEVVLVSGKVDVSATNAYGVWAKDGTITLGEAEPVDSPNRGTANANVSATAPEIKALGTTAGYAATLEGGNLNYYDGKLIQNEQGFPAYKANHTEKATITNKEYWYEPQVAQDGDGHYYYILTYMPEG